MQEIPTPAALVLVLTFSGLTALAVSGICADRAEKAAIQHGAAHYDAKTGAFTWNSEKP